MFYFLWLDLCTIVPKNIRNQKLTNDKRVPVFRFFLHSRKYSHLDVDAIDGAVRLFPFAKGNKNFMRGKARAGKSVRRWFDSI